MAIRTESRLYDRDFHAWTQEQARELRRMAGHVSRNLDTDRLAEEVEDLGKRERRKLRRHLHHCLRHLVKLAWSPATDTRSSWRREVRDHRRFALEVLQDSPGLRQYIDFDAVWADALAEAGADLGDFGESPPPKLDQCPIALDDLLQPTFDVDAAIRTMAAAFEGAAKPGR